MANPLLISLVECIIKILVRLVMEKPSGPKQARTYAVSLFFFFIIIAESEEELKSLLMKLK